MYRNSNFVPVLPIRNSPSYYLYGTTLLLSTNECRHLAFWSNQGTIMNVLKWSSHTHESGTERFSLDIEQIFSKPLNVCLEFFYLYGLNSQINNSKIAAYFDLLKTNLYLRTKIYEKNYKLTIYLYQKSQKSRKKQ